jgi:protease I
VENFTKEAAPVKNGGFLWRLNKYRIKHAIFEIPNDAGPGNVQEMLDKEVTAICHGPQSLIEAGVVEGRELTSNPFVKTDLKYAGARWVDQEVVVDQGLVTSRHPDDMPAFVAKMIEKFAGGVRAGQHK